MVALRCIARDHEASITVQMVASKRTLTGFWERPKFAENRFIRYSVVEFNRPKNFTDLRVRRLTLATGTATP